LICRTRPKRSSNNLFVVVGNNHTDCRNEASPSRYPLSILDCNNPCHGSYSSAHQSISCPWKDLIKVYALFRISSQ
jgi:hypothetical protein